MSPQPKGKTSPLRDRVRDVLVGEISRFTIVGIFASLTYLVASNILILSFDVRPTVASVGAYVLGMVVSFIGQSQYTFRVGQASLEHLIRFSVLSACGLLFSYFSVIVVVDVWKQHPVWATLATVIIVPVFSYVVMKVWVFSIKRADT